MMKMGYNTGFHPEAKLASLSFGCKTDWYIHANVAACQENVEHKLIGKKLWPQGWFATVAYTNHDEMRDFGVDQKDETTVSGPYPTKEQALAAAKAGLGEVEARLG